MTSSKRIQLDSVLTWLSAYNVSEAGFSLL